MNIITPKNPIDLGSPEWREARRKHVGGSEVAALFGLSPHTTRLQLWHQKKGTLPEPDLSDDERVLWGTILEPAIAVGVRRRMKWMLQKSELYIPHPRVAGMAASLDYTAEHNSKDWGALEIKTVDRLQFMGWEEGEPPLSYQLQLQAQLACCPDFKWGAIAVLIGGNELRIFEYERHEATIRKIEAEVAAFWQSIREGKEPPADFGADLDTLKALHRDSDGLTRTFKGHNRLPVLCAEYQAASAEEKAAEERKRAAQAEIFAIIDKAEVALTDGWKISAKTVPGGPVAYERKPYRGFRVTEIKAKEQGA